MKVLVTGANGLLGQHLIQLLLHRGFTVVGTGKGPSRLEFPEGTSYTYRQMDMSNPVGWSQLLDAEVPECIVHAAALTQVDECELNPDACFEINTRGTERLIHQAIPFRPFFIFVSTDFVFDGEKGNYQEEDETHPINIYGQSKEAAEHIVQHSGLDWSIVRTCLVYGNTIQGTRNNIISWVRNKLEKNEPIQVVNDQWRTPTYIKDLALGIFLLIQKKAGGIFHISGKDTLTPYEMAILTAAYCGLDEKLIRKVDASVFSQPARRPPKTGFIIEKARAMLQFEPMSFSMALDDFLSGKGQE